MHGWMETCLLKRNEFNAQRKNKMKNMQDGTSGFHINLPSGIYEVKPWAQLWYSVIHLNLLNYITFEWAVEFLVASQNGWSRLPGKTGKPGKIELQKKSEKKNVLVIFHDLSEALNMSWESGHHRTKDPWLKRVRLAVHSRRGISVKSDTSHAQSYALSDPSQSINIDFLPELMNLPLGDIYFFNNSSIVSNNCCCFINMDWVSSEFTYEL